MILFLSVFTAGQRSGTGLQGLAVFKKAQPKRSEGLNDLRALQNFKGGAFRSKTMNILNVWHWNLV